MNIGVLGSTKGTDLQFLIDAKKNNMLHAEISMVISNKEDAYILERAKNHAIPAQFIAGTREEFENQVTKIFEQQNIELIVLIGYMRILSPSFVHHWKEKVINVHPSLLPKYAGLMGSEIHKKVLENKDTETGMSIHVVDEGVDTGEILLQKKVEVTQEDTEESLKAKVQALEGQGFIEVINNFAKQVNV